MAIIHVIRTNLVDRDFNNADIINVFFLALIEALIID